MDRTEDGMEDRLNAQGDSFVDTSRAAPFPPQPDQAQVQAAAAAVRANLGMQTPGPPPVDYNIMGQVVGAAVFDAMNQYDALQQQRRAEEKEMEEGTKRMAAENERRVAAQPRVYAETPTGVAREKFLANDNQKPNYAAQFAAEDSKPAVEVADRPFGPLDKEAVLIVTSIITVVAMALPWVGITVTDAEIDRLVQGTLLMLNAGMMLAGIVGGLIARSKVNSAATVARLKKEGGK